MRSRSVGRQEEPSGDLAKSSPFARSGILDDPNQVVTIVRPDLGHPWGIPDEQRRERRDQVMFPSHERDPVDLLDRLHEPVKFLLSETRIHLEAEPSLNAERVPRRR